MHVAFRYTCLHGDMRWDLVDTAEVRSIDLVKHNGCCTNQAAKNTVVHMEISVVRRLACIAGVEERRKTLTDVRIAFSATANFPR